VFQPYRPRTKGKVERFIRNPRGSFWVPLASRMAVEGLVVDAAAANLAAARWLGANGYGDARHLGINGGSAGGFLRTC